MTRRLKVLMSAYACEPAKGSEPGVGWNLAVHMASHHDVWVLTRANNRVAIEEALAKKPRSGLYFEYYDLPGWARFWKRGQRGVQMYYYLWQLGALRIARKLHRAVKFDLAQHVTFVCYWKPSFLPLLGIPYLLGPVGGGESMPRSFRRSLGVHGRVHEALRDSARWVGEHDPLVQRTIREARQVLVTTPETGRRIERLGARRTRVVSQVALAREELDSLARCPVPPSRPFRVVSIGRFLAWKGYHLALGAFAQAELPGAEYWFFGDGPERRRLERMAHDLGIAERVRFWGFMARADVLERLGECHVLLHPSLHESGGCVCMEAMACARPVICLDLGGPTLQVTHRTGFKVPAHAPEQTVRGIAHALWLLAGNGSVWTRMSEGARTRARAFSWRDRTIEISRAYEAAVG